jgi:hypothetical protein
MSIGADATIVSRGACESPQNLHRHWAREQKISGREADQRFAGCKSQLFSTSPSVWSSEPAAIEIRRRASVPPMRTSCPVRRAYLDFRPSVDRSMSIHHTKRTGAAPSQILPSAPPKLASDVTLAGSRRTKRSTASTPNANSRRASERFPPSPRLRSHARFGSLM